MNIRLNANTGDWDWDTLANEWRVEDLTDWGLDIPNFEIDEVEEKEQNKKLSDRYIIPPFSVLDTKQGIWVVS